MKPAKTVSFYRPRRLLVQTLFALVIPLASAEFIQGVFYFLLSVASSIFGNASRNLAFLYSHYGLILKYFIPLYAFMCVGFAFICFILKKYVTANLVAVLLIITGVFSIIFGLDLFPQNDMLFSVKQFISSFVW